MSEMNGVPRFTKRPGCQVVDDDNWEIVYDGGAGFIGKVIEHGDRWVRMRPCFHYASQPNVKVHPNGAKEFNDNNRVAFPIEMLASSIAPQIVYSRRYPLRDCDDYDLDIYDKVLQEAIGLVKKVREGRPGAITLETSIPKVPLPGARG